MSSGPPARMGPIGLGDLVRAIGAIEPTPEEARAIAKLLGLRSVEAPAANREPAAHREAQLPRPRLVSPPVRPPLKPHRVPEPPEERRPEARRLPELAIEPLDADRASLPAWRAVSRPFRETTGAPWPLESLLEPRAVRATLSAALATPSEDGPLHMDRLIELLSELRHVDPLPRDHAPTLRRGAQVLVERSEAMLPHFRDADDLLRRLDGIVTTGSLPVLHFDEDPTSTYTDDSSELTPYQPPPMGTPVLAVTLLGLGRSHGAASWLHFAAALRRRGSRLVALVPYLESRVPPSMREAMVVLAWDRTTTIASVRRALSRAGVPQ